MASPDFLSDTIIVATHNQRMEDLSSFMMNDAMHGLPWTHGLPFMLGEEDALIDGPSTTVRIHLGL